MANEKPKQILFTASLWLAVMGGVGSFTSCYGHNCDGSTAFYGRNPGEGEMVGPDVWESSPEDGDAIPYTRERTWFFEVPALLDRKIVLVVPYVRAEQNVATTGGNETLGSGNLAEVSGVSAGRFAVHNDTCADYFIRVVAILAPANEPVPSPSSTAAADSSDGGTEASSAPLP